MERAQVERLVTVLFKAETRQDGWIQYYRRSALPREPWRVMWSAPTMEAMAAQYGDAWDRVLGQLEGMRVIEGGRRTMPQPSTSTAGALVMVK